MEGYIRLLDAYKLTGRHRIIKRVFFDRPGSKKLLYFLWILVLFLLAVSATDLDSIYIACAIVPTIFGAFRYKCDLYRTYDVLFTSNSVRSFVKEYGLNYQGLRYLIFKDKLGVFTYDEIENARQYLKIKKEHKKNSNVKSHLIIVGLIGVLAAVSNQIIERFPNEFLYLLLFLILITIPYAVMLLHMRLSPEDRDVEFSLFLAWLEKDLDKDVQ